MSWLLVGGAVIAVGLAAWAFFAPDRPDSGPGASRRDGPEPPRNEPRFRVPPVEPRRPGGLIASGWRSSESRFAGSTRSAPSRWSACSHASCWSCVPQPGLPGRWGETDVASSMPGFSGSRAGRWRSPWEPASSTSGARSEWRPGRASGRAWTEAGSSPSCSILATGRSGSPGPGSWSSWPRSSVWRARTARATGWRSAFRASASRRRASPSARWRATPLRWRARSSRWGSTRSTSWRAGCGREGWCRSRSVSRGRAASRSPASRRWRPSASRGSGSPPSRSSRRRGRSRPGNRWAPCRRFSGPPTAGGWP